MTDNDAQAEEEPQIVDVTITAPDVDWLRQHCAMLIEKRLAASANIIPAIDSIYRWQGEIHHATEAYAMIRTTSALVETIVSSSVSGHPYENPHVVSRPIVGGSESYLRWVRSSTS